MRDEASHTDHTGIDNHDCRGGTRNRFFRGKTMKADDFHKEQRYFIGRRRLITSSVLGWGVVYGLPVDGPRATAPGRTDSDPDHGESPAKAHDEPPPKCAENGTIKVGRGLALDRHGREIDGGDGRSLGPGNTFLVEEDASGCLTRSLDKLTPGRYLLSIHYAERGFADANLPDSCGCDDPEKKYVCETAVFSLRPVETPGCPCGEAPCGLSCNCGTRSACSHGSRGPHACLCEWVTGRDSGTAVTALCEWRGYRIDPADGVPLACVIAAIEPGKCGPELVGCVEDDCSPRRLVKSNDLLYDLIRGCDLARISWISWAHWHRSDLQMPWRAFAELFGENGSTGFIVRFSHPILEETLKRDVIVINAVTTEQATGWRVARRIPVDSLDLSPQEGYLPDYPRLPPGTTNQMAVKVRPEWVRDEIERGRDSWLSERNFRIEIEIYGDYILDCHGQAIDANPVGLRRVPTGNGSPGGTYRSNFRVERKQRAGSDDGA